MKNKENAKAIGDLKNQAIDGDKVKGGGGGSAKFAQRNKGEQTIHDRAPGNIAPERPGTKNWSQSRLRN